MSFNRYDILKKPKLTNADVDEYLVHTFDREQSLVCKFSEFILYWSYKRIKHEVAPMHADMLGIIIANEFTDLSTKVEFKRNSEPAPNEIFECLEKFLLYYWRIIRNVPKLQYHYNPTFHYHSVCMDIALLCAKGLNKSCAEVLYPALKDCNSPIELVPLVDASRVPALPLVCTNFVLSDCGQYTIEIDYCLEAAINDGELRHTQKPEHPLLSAIERDRVVSHNRFAKKLYAAILEWKHFNTETPNVGACISALIKGLRDGGAHRDTFHFLSGEENNAGKQANDAITEFTENLKLLSAEKLATLQAMRSQDFTWTYLFDDLTNENHHIKLNAMFNKLMENARTAEYLNCKLALSRVKKEDPRFKELTHAVERAEMLCTADELALIKEYEKLESTPGKCVEIQAKAWLDFLQVNEEKLYSMTLNSTADVRGRLASLKQRLAEYVTDLQQYLALLDKYLMKVATRKRLPNHLVHFKADCLNESNEQLCAEFIAQWLITCPDDVVLTERIHRLTNILDQCPIALFEMDLIRGLPASVLRLLVKEEGDRFILPVVQSFVGRKCSLDDVNCINEILVKCDDVYVSTNIIRLIIAVIDTKPLAQDEGYTALQTAVRLRRDVVIKLLVDKGAAVTKSGYATHVIKEAYEQNNIDSVKLLLPTVQEPDLDLLAIACQSNSITIFKLTYERYIALGLSGVELAEMMFSNALKYSNYILLEFAVDHGARRGINGPDSLGYTLLMRCIRANLDNGTLRAIQALVRVGADVDYIHPELKCTVLTYAIRLYWINCICYFNYDATTPEQDKSTRCNQMEGQLTYARLVLAALLTGKLPPNIIEEEVIKHPVQWILNNISMENFSTSILIEYEFLKNLLYVADLMSNEQLKYLMQKYRALWSKLSRLNLPKKYDEQISECKWDGLLLSLMSSQPTPLQCCVIFLLLHHPEITLSHKQLLKHAISCRLLAVVERLSFTDEDMVFSRLIDINANYISDIAILFCKQLDAKYAGMETDACYLTLQQQLMGMCLEHDDGALVSHIMASRAGDIWKAYREDLTGMTLLMRAADRGCINVYNALLQSQCSLTSINEKDGCATVYDYVCDKLSELAARMSIFDDEATERLPPYLQMVLHFPLDKSLVSLVMDEINKNRKKSKCYPTTIPTLLKILIKFASMQRFKEAISRYGGVLILINIAEDLILEMSDEQAAWFANKYFDGVFRHDAAEKWERNTNSEMHAYMRGRHESWRTRMILLKYPDIDMEYIDKTTASCQSTLHLMTSDPVNLRFVIKKCKPNINLRTHGIGSTPLMIAILHGRFESATVLLEHGADLTLKNEDDETAMHYAATEYDSNWLYLLLKHAGAKAQQLLLAPNCRNQTPLTLKINRMHGADSHEVEKMVDCLKDIIGIEKLYFAAHAVTCIPLMAHLEVLQNASLITAINENNAKAVTSILSFGIESMCEPAMCLARELEHHEICAQLAMHALKKSGFMTSRLQYGVLYTKPVETHTQEIAIVSALLTRIERYLSQHEYKTVSLSEALANEDVFLKASESNSLTLRSLYCYISGNNETTLRPVMRM